MTNLQTNHRLYLPKLISDLIIEYSLCIREYSVPRTNSVCQCYLKAQGVFEFHHPFLSFKEALKQGKVSCIQHWNFHCTLPLRCDGLSPEQISHNIQLSIGTHELSLSLGAHFLLTRHSQDNISRVEILKNNKLLMYTSYQIMDFAVAPNKLGFWTVLRQITWTGSTFVLLWTWLRYDENNDISFGDSVPLWTKSYPTFHFHATADLDPEGYCVIIHSMIEKSDYDVLYAVPFSSKISCPTSTKQKGRYQTTWFLFLFWYFEAFYWTLVVAVIHPQRFNNVVQDPMNSLQPVFIVWTLFIIFTNLQYYWQELFSHYNTTTSLFFHILGSFLMLWSVETQALVLLSIVVRFLIADGVSQKKFAFALAILFYVFPISQIVFLSCCYDIIHGFHFITKTRIRPRMILIGATFIFSSSLTCCSALLIFAVASYLEGRFTTDNKFGNKIYSTETASHLIQVFESSLRAS